MSWLQQNPEERLLSLRQQIKITKQQVCEYQNQLSQRDIKHTQQIQEFSIQFKKKQAQIAKLCEQLKFLIVQHQNLKKQVQVQKTEFEDKISEKSKQINSLKVLLELFNQQKNGVRYDVLRRIYIENENLKSKIENSKKLVNSAVSKDIEILNLKKSNNYFKEQIAKLAHQFDQLSSQQDRMQSYVNEMQKLKTQNTNLNLLVQQFRQKDDLQRKLESKNKNLIKQLNEKIEAKDKQITKLLEFLKKQNTLKNEEVEKLSKQIISIREKFERKQKQVTKATADLESLKLEKVSKSEEIKKLRKQLEFAKDENNSLTIFINSFTLKDKELENYAKNEIYLKKVLKDTIEAKDKQINKLLDDVNAQKILRVQQQAQIKKIKDSLDSLKFQGSFKNEDLLKCQKQIRILKQQNANLTKLYDAMASKDIRYEQKMKAQKRNMQQIISAKDKEIKMLRDQSSNLKVSQSSYRIKESQNEKLQRQLASLKKHSQNIYSTKMAEITDLVNSIKKLKNQQQEDRLQIQTLKDQNKMLKHNSSYKKNQEVQRQIAQLKNQISIKDRQILQQINLRKAQDNAKNEEVQALRRQLQKRQDQTQIESFLPFNLSSPINALNTARERIKTQDNEDRKNNPWRYKKNGELKKYPDIICKHFQKGTCNLCINQSKK